MRATAWANVSDKVRPYSDSWGERPRERHVVAVRHRVAHLYRYSGKGPQSKAFVINLQEIGKSSDRVSGVSEQPRPAVEQVLRGIVRAVSYERLWIDDEPMFSVRSKDVAGVQVGRQHNISRAAARQLAEQAQTFADESPVSPSVASSHRFIRPMRQHRR
jgi:hypothetical protein